MKGLAGTRVRRGARAVGGAGREAPRGGHTQRPPRPGTQGARVRGGPGVRGPRRGCGGRVCTTEGIHHAVSSWEQTSPLHRFPFSEDGLGAGGEGASLKRLALPQPLRVRAPTASPRPQRPQGLRMGTGRLRAGPDAGVRSARPGSTGWLVGSAPRSPATAPGPRPRRSSA